MSTNSMNTKHTPTPWDGIAMRGRLVEMRKRARARSGVDVYETILGHRVSATHYQHSGNCVMGIDNRVGVSDGTILFTLMHSALLSARKSEVTP